MGSHDHFVRVEFKRFKAFKSFTFSLRHINILVGPNNAGKSTILTAFRILFSGMRRAASRNPEVVPGPSRETLGYPVDLTAMSVAEENIFYNYDDTSPASVTFKLSNGNQLILHFPPTGRCFLIPVADRPIRSPSSFKANFDCQIGFVPILGPVEHNEQLYEKEAARLALLNHRAARNFRNIWHHYPEQFDQFRDTLRRTWPGMDVERPTVDIFDRHSRLTMMCPEERIPREIYWSGFGFQVWCQMLTHLIQSADKAIFLIDEPDIYLHSELQRQLLGLLRDLGPDIVIATHSTEIITEADTDDLVLISKARNASHRIRNPDELASVFSLLGSSLNPALTQLAKTKCAVFVEGKDFQIIGRIAQKLGNNPVSMRTGFAVIPVEGFNPQKIKHFIAGMEATLGAKIKSAAILDRDYRSSEERAALIEECRGFCNVVAIHQRKEIENYLLVPSAIDKAAAKRLRDQVKRAGGSDVLKLSSQESLDEIATSIQTDVISQHISSRARFEKWRGSGKHDSTFNKEVLEEVNKTWCTFEGRMQLIPGKESLSSLNRKLQELHGISVTPTAIIDAMSINEVPEEMKLLVHQIGELANQARASFDTEN